MILGAPSRNRSSCDMRPKSFERRGRVPMERCRRTTANAQRRSRLKPQKARRIATMSSADKPATEACDNNNNNNFGPSNHSTRCCAVCSNVLTPGVRARAFRLDDTVRARPLRRLAQPYEPMPREAPVANSRRLVHHRCRLVHHRRRSIFHPGASGAFVRRSAVSPLAQTLMWDGPKPEGASPPSLAGIGGRI